VLVIFSPFDRLGGYSLRTLWAMARSGHRRRCVLCRFRVPHRRGLPRGTASFAIWQRLLRILSRLLGMPTGEGIPDRSNRLGGRRAGHWALFGPRPPAPSIYVVVNWFRRMHAYGIAGTPGQPIPEAWGRLALDPVLRVLLLLDGSHSWRPRRFSGRRFFVLVLWIFPVMASVQRQSAFQPSRTAQLRPSSDSCRSSLRAVVLWLYRDVVPDSRALLVVCACLVPWQVHS